MAFHMTDSITGLSHPAPSDIFKEVQTGLPGEQSLKFVTVHLTHNVTQAICLLDALPTSSVRSAEAIFIASEILFNLVLNTRA